MSHMDRAFPGEEEHSQGRKSIPRGGSKGRGLEAAPCVGYKGAWRWGGLENQGPGA